MIEAGLILQEAAAIYDDRNAHHVQSYGPEARGGAARSEVIVSDGDIDYPKATQIDFFVATTQEAVDRWSGDLRPEATVIVDSAVPAPALAGRRLVRIPMLEAAERLLGRPGLVQIVALGALVEASRIVSSSAIEAAVRDHVPRGGEDVFMRALELGASLVRTALSDLAPAPQAD